MKVFREYIGALYNGVQFTDVPINSGVTFHFILAFAIDYTSAAAATNGVFNIYWQNSVLTPAAVQAIKAQHSNVKVMVSLGGDTISGSPVQFTATSVSSWVANAVSSLTSLINQYHLDGIDIDYEHFDQVSTSTFVSCIGQLITQLKANNVISVASIAPFDGVESQYTALFGQYSSVIDLVNFQFYSYGAGTSASQYVSLYNTAASKYGGGAKVLASFSTGGVGPAPSTVLSACQQLKSSGTLPGIFIFSADGSYASSAKFQYEQQAQTLLTS
uniref:Chitinase A n=1 Tax=Pteris ryukyuensis TaxID=367335 RepID=UPI0006CE4932|nr:Chain A, Chitinase A [Pteris ryukyuensis]4RL3_B Chain B, Chitinase A [Pteris ryukyuensis]